MLAALLTALCIALFGGASNGKKLEQSARDAQKRMEQAIPDKSRREQAVGHMKEIRKTIEKYDKEVDKTGSDITRRLKHHDITSEQMKDIFDGLAREREKAVNRVIDERFKMKETMNRGEWEKTFKQS